jgi:hypothetical protein
MGNLIFSGHRTGLNFQHWMEDEVVPDDRRCTYDHCPACMRLHFINRSSGKRLGEKDKKVRRVRGLLVLH